MPIELRSEAGTYEGKVWRVVESQSRISTMRLTDTIDGQRLLEDLIEETKPPVPESCRHLHYLLFTPFRYAPYPTGSRFRRAHQREGVFYAAENLRTAFAEAVFHLVRFLSDSAAVSQKPQFRRTGFSVDLRSDSAIDLGRPPLSDQGDWDHPTDYTACQALADQARTQGIEILHYLSVRAADGTKNIAVLAPAAFAATAPDPEFQHWTLLVDPGQVRIIRDIDPAQAWRFPRDG